MIEGCIKTRSTPASFPPVIVKWTTIRRGCTKYRDQFVNASQINYSAEVNNWSAKHTDKSEYFAITECNDFFIVWSPSLFFRMNIFRKRGDLPFSKRAIARRRKAWFYLHMIRILIICSQTYWTTLRMSRPFISGSYLQAMWLALGQCTVHIRYGTWEINSKDLMSDKYLNQEHIRRYWDNKNEL